MMDDDVEKIYDDACFCLFALRFHQLRKLHVEFIGRRHFFKVFAGSRISSFTDIQISTSLSTMIDNRIACLSILRVNSE